jgi:hypothetical protein
VAEHGDHALPGSRQVGQPDRFASEIRHVCGRASDPAPARIWPCCPYDAVTAVRRWPPPVEHTLDEASAGTVHQLLSEGDQGQQNRDRVEQEGLILRKAVADSEGLRVGSGSRTTVPGSPSLMPPPCPTPGLTRSSPVTRSAKPAPPLLVPPTVIIRSREQQQPAAADKPLLDPIYQH